MIYKFKYGRETKNTVQILSHDERYTFGKVRFKERALYIAYDANGEAFGEYSTRGMAASAVAQWGYDHVSRQ